MKIFSCRSAVRGIYLQKASGWISFTCWTYKVAVFNRTDGSLLKAEG